MTACGRKSRPRGGRRPVVIGILAGSVAALIGLAPPGAVWAQMEPTPLSAPTPLLPAPASSAEPAEAPVEPPAESPMPSGRSTLRVEELQAVSGDSFGVLDGSAGLGLDLWRGTRRSQMVELLSLTPGATRSHVMNDLTRRVVLTTATVPAAEGGAAGGPSLLALRAARLASLGDYESLSRLVAAAPGEVRDETILRQMVEGHLLLSDNAAACKRTRALVTRFDDPFWRKTLIFCQLIVGEQEPAYLGAALLREQDPKTHTTFHALLRAMRGDKTVKLAKMSEPTPLDLGMLKAAKLPVPEEAMDSRHAGMIAAMAGNGATPIERRIALAERAEALGTLPTAELATLYGAMTFTPEQIANALAESDTRGGAEGRALLHVAQSRQTVPSARAELLQRAFVMARAAGLFPTALRLYQEPLLAIRPSPELAWFAGEAARALFAVNRQAEARAWLGLVGRGFASTQGNVSADVAAFPYDLLTSQQAAPWDAARWLRWKQAQGNAASLKATLLLTLLEGLDRAAPDEAWDGLGRVQVDPAAHLPSPATMRRMEVAAATERRGAAVLAALATLGPEGPAGCHPLVLGMTLAALRNVGLQAEAQALALDAALGGDL